MVNHKKNFNNPKKLASIEYIGPRGGKRIARQVSIHTQNVERFNGLIKSYMRRFRGISSQCHEGMLYEALFYVQNRGTLHTAVAKLLTGRFSEI